MMITALLSSIALCGTTLAIITYGGIDPRWLLVGVMVWPALFFATPSLNSFYSGYNLGAVLILTLLAVVLAIAVKLVVIVKEYHDRKSHETKPPPRKLSAHTIRRRAQLQDRDSRRELKSPTKQPRPRLSIAHLHGD
jgi:hypothetical protein